MTQDLAGRLLEYPFPGNVRELENIMAAAILLEKGKVLTLSSVSALLANSEPGQGCNQELITLSELEKLHIQKVLEAMNGNRTRAAKILGIGLRTLQRKIKTFGALPTAPM